MTLASGSAARKNIMEGIIKMITVITLETVFKRGEISGCATASARNVDGIIPPPQGFMMSCRVIQALYVFQLIMTVGSCQAPLPIVLIRRIRISNDTGAHRHIDNNLG